MAKRVIVTGGSGLLGRQLVQRFASDEWDCLGLAYSRARGKLRKVRKAGSLSDCNVLRNAEVKLCQLIATP